MTGSRRRRRRASAGSISRCAVPETDALPQAAAGVGPIRKATCPAATRHPDAGGWRGKAGCWRDPFPRPLPAPRTPTARCATTGCSGAAASATSPPAQSGWLGNPATLDARAPVPVCQSRLASTQGPPRNVAATRGSPAPGQSADFEPHSATAPTRAARCPGCPRANASRLESPETSAPPPPRGFWDRRAAGFWRWPVSRLRRWRKPQATREPARLPPPIPFLQPPTAL